MDETENTNSTNVTNTAAHDVSNELKAEARQTMNEVKGLSFRDLFSFNTLIFPKIASILFILFGLFSFAYLCLGVVVVLSSNGIVAGIITLVAGCIGIVFTLIGARIWFEVMLVAFKIHENVLEIKNHFKNTK